MEHSLIAMAGGGVTGTSSFHLEMTRVIGQSKSRACTSFSERSKEVQSWHLHEANGSGGYRSFSVLPSGIWNDSPGSA